MYKKKSCNNIDLLQDFRRIMKNDDEDQSDFMNLGKIMAYLGIFRLRIVKREVL